MTVLEEDVVSILAGVAHTHPRDFSIYIPFTNYRVDSLELASAAIGLEEKYDIIISDETLATFKCGADIIAYLETL